MAQYNPFRPGKIANRKLFSGRLRELSSLEKALSQTELGNAHHFLIHGERGIGKSSLLHYLEAIARGDRSTAGGRTYKFLTINVELEGNNHYVHIIRKIAKELRKKIDEHQRIKSLAESAWAFLQKWEILGVKYSGGEEHFLPELAEDLAVALAKTSHAIKGEFDGIVILIDEADKPSPTAELGQLSKLLTEKFTKSGSENIALGISGQTSVIDKLRRSHESSPRIFEMIMLEPLSPEESLQVIHQGLRELSQKQGVHISITGSAAQIIADYSEGYPHFIQEFAYWTLEANTTHLIDPIDVQNGLCEGPNSAFRQIGQKYFDDVYFDRIISGDYRAILQAVSSTAHNDWISRADVRAKSGLEERAFAKGFASLRQRNIVQKKEGSRRLYRLPSPSFAVWIRAYAKLGSGAF